ncbi:hypothetical protein M0R04_08990 [Candidatus Dojkabacteria bacterium]|jgi:hypothetical protein|nr:hypothetical protein [Candidatus Dojkabacteria bacterium]
MKQKTNNKYIFPNFLAVAMKNTEMKTQLQSAMLSMALLLIGMILMGIYSIIYLTQGWFFKGLVVFNILAGFMFMSSYLVTTYQQYVSYLDAVEIQQQMNPETIPPKRKKNRLNQFLFFFGLILLIGSISSYFLFDISYWIFGLSVLGLFMMIIVFFRKPKDKPKDKEDKDKPQSEGYERFKKRFRKLPNDKKTQDRLLEKYNLELKEKELQNELDQQEQGYNTKQEETPFPYEDEVTQLEQEPKGKDTQYVDYTQYTQQPTRKFKGKDGRIYYG